MPRISNNPYCAGVILFMASAGGFFPVRGPLPALFRPCSEPDSATFKCNKCSKAVSSIYICCERSHEHSCYTYRLVS